MYDPLAMSSTSFPDHLPAGCPPPEAVDASGVVYRIVAGETLTNGDFLSHQELGIGLNASACGRCGVSVFNSLKNAQHRQQLTPRLGKAVAEGTLEPSAGKTHLTSTKSGHME
jgi:hypothetical protein